MKSTIDPQARFYQIRREHWEMFERWNLEDHHQVQLFEVRRGFGCLGRCMCVMVVYVLAILQRLEVRV